METADEALAEVKPGLGVGGSGGREDGCLLGYPVRKATGGWPAFDCGSNESRQDGWPWGLYKGS